MAKLKKKKILIFSALAISDLLFVCSSISRGIRVTMNHPFSDPSNEYPIIYPVVKWINHFSYCLSIYLTVILIMERYYVFVKAGAKAKDSTRIKKVLAFTVLAALLSNITLMFEFKWDEEWRVVKTDTRKDPIFSRTIAYLGLLCRFILPTLAIIKFSFSIIQKVNCSIQILTQNNSFF